MTSDEDLAGFISSSFRSVWALELLLLLKRERRAWSNQEMVASLRASESVVFQALESLVAGGLATTDGEGRVSFMPVSAKIERLVEEAEQLYARKPDSVRRLIVASSARGLDAFADAFKLRKG